MNRMLRFASGVLVVFFVFTGHTSAAYNANLQGVLSGVFVYTDGDYIYFTFANQPTEHASCNPRYFVVPETVPFERRQMILSRLLTAYATKELVNIGYDNQIECANGYIKVHRVG